MGPRTPRRVGTLSTPQCLVLRLSSPWAGRAAGERVRGQIVGVDSGGLHPLMSISHERVYESAANADHALSRPVEPRPEPRRISAPCDLYTEYRLTGG
jgi:hypothetical protein